MKIRHALTGIAAGALLFVGAGAADATTQSQAQVQVHAVAAGPTITTNFFLNSSGLCLDADTGTLHAKSTKVQLWTCNGQVQQLWVFHVAPGNPSAWVITNTGGDNKCLDADTGTINHNGTIVHLYPCDNNAVQQWYLEQDSNGNLYLQSAAAAASGKYLDAASERAGQNGDPVQLWAWNGGGASQRWSMITS